ncbi:hypothetical protein BH10PSE2_BH10PSE2_24600 [soil metagenome]
MNQRGPSATEMGYGCLALVVVLVVLVIGLAVVFVWDVNQPHA